ncbi:hypothetical protein H4R33_006927 [Dimargaris cristalligena]|uniref:GPN-loop GTPase 3 n=1 Tax=Dimargaris cristalligena TaxID=215637 RepID=A0A4P9ZKE0_9FUNG|nr:hypothetical protein H4R33_006927 [Dimargaris cristalligena]RKP33707.1 GPN-loop GTPase [Dimargaris cristalligena]|eukprot:RKP33707.1 GPN-loop GTPase [Dimargaris cristalligena]
MGRHCQMVMGPAGSGKSTYCATMMTHCQNTGRAVHLVNLDPAAEHFEYPPSIDIRELITLEDVMEELDYGPNGGLIYCMEFLLNNIDWLEEELGDFEDDYLIFDCPGQIELYTHFPIMRRVCETLQRWNFMVCGVYILDSQFVQDTAKYFSGVMTATSAMINLEIPHINVMSKMDIVLKRATMEELEQYFDPDPLLLVEDANSATRPKFYNLNRAIARLIDDFSVVSFIPLDITNEDSIDYVMSSIDTAIQYGEDLEPKEPREDGGDGDDE